MKAERKKKKPVKASNTWTCPNCPGNPQFEHKDFIEHVKAVHKLTELKGKRSMTMHVDCSDSYMSSYEWEVAGLKFYQSTINPRQKGEGMSWQ